MAETRVGSKPRYEFIDVYRSIIILLMLEGHIVRAVLDTSLQRTMAFTVHEFFHGITAPAFLFGAGLTFIISTRKRWEDFHHWGKPLARRIGRLLLIICLGLTVHLPFLSFRKTLLEGTQQQYLTLFQCDVLICIGIGLLTLHGLLFFFKKESYFYSLVALVVAVTCFLTPLVWDIDFLPLLPIPVAQLFNTMHGSPFPLFPFVGYLYAGVILSWEFLVAIQRNREALFMRRVALVGLGLIAAGIMIDALPISVYPTYNFWYTSPNYFFIRTGGLLLLVSGCWHGTQYLRRPPSSLTLLGRESLFVYGLHLPIVYGSVVNLRNNLTYSIGPTMDVMATAGVTIGAIVAISFMAVIWHSIKTNQYYFYRLLQIGAAGTFLFKFFTRDY